MLDYLTFMILTLHLAHAIVIDDGNQVFSEISVRNPTMYFCGSYYSMM